MVVQVFDGFLATTIATMGSFENIVVLLLLLKHRINQTTTDVLVAFLTVADLLVCIISVPLFLVIHVLGTGILATKQTSILLLNNIFHITEATTSCLAITFLAILAFDRYFVIVHPFVYQRHVTLNVTYGIILN